MTHTTPAARDEKMWTALVAAPSTLVLTSVPKPTEDRLRPDEMLVRPLIGGICGSDLPFFTTGVGLNGEVLGTGVPLHEILAEVIACPREPERVGSVVVGWARDNDGLAEFVVTGVDDVAGVAGIEPRLAIVAQPLACVIAAVDRLAVSPVGEHVAVLGCGPIGLLFAEVLAARGARRVTGVDPIRRLPDPSVFGIDDFVPTTAQQWAAELGDSDRPAVIIEAVGHDHGIVTAAIDAAAEWAHIYLFGLPDVGTHPVDLFVLLRKHLTLYSGTTGRDRHRYLAAAFEYLRRRPEIARELVTDVFPVSELQDAFARAARPAANHGKVLVDMATT